MTRLRDLFHRDSGFGLIEVLAVMVVVGLLAAIAIPRISAHRERAADAALRNDARTIINIGEQVKADTGAYPATVSDMAAIWTADQRSPHVILVTYVPHADGESVNFRLRHNKSQNEQLVLKNKLQPIIVR